MKIPTTQAAGLAALARALADAKAPWLVALVLCLALILGACTVDSDRIARERANLEQLCQGAVTTYLRMACARAGVDTAPQPGAP